MMDTLVGERVPFGFRRCQAERLARGMAPPLLEHRVPCEDSVGAAVFLKGMPCNGLLRSALSERSLPVQARPFADPIEFIARFGN
jgi:hypothetical protein